MYEGSGLTFNHHNSISMEPWLSAIPVVLVHGGRNKRLHTGRRDKQEES